MADSPSSTTIGLDQFHLFNDAYYLVTAKLLVPNVTFPVPLEQARSALEHFVVSGVQPQIIQNVRDQGKKLILQPLSHILRLIDTGPLLLLPYRIGRFYLVSSLAHGDIAGTEIMRHWGRTVVADVPDHLSGRVQRLKLPISD
jgi:hypothetical protein